MSMETFIKQRPYLIWYVKKFKHLSEDAVLESVLNYGNWDDVQKVIGILGINKAAEIFRKQLRQKRINYPPKIANYFKLYFDKNA